MKWKGFLKESKFYMGYPGWKREGDLYCEGTWYPRGVGDEELTEWRKDHFRQKVDFWIRFPLAAWRYFVAILADSRRFYP